MRLSFSKREINTLRKLCKSKYGISEDVFDSIIQDLIIISEQKKIKKRPFINTTDELLRFSKIFHTVTGLNYFPTFGIDNRILTKVHAVLKKNKVNLENFFIWVCQKYRARILKDGIKFFSYIVNEYLAEKGKSI